MKKKILPVLIVITLIIILSVIYTATLIKEHYEPTSETMDLSEYYNLNTPESAAIIIDGEVSEEQALILDGAAYVSSSFVRNHLNARFYYDANEQLLLFTEGTETLCATADSSSYQINGVDVSADLPIFTIRDEICYINADFVQSNSPISYHYFENPSRLVFTASTEEYETASVKKDTEVRYRGGIKSPILTLVSTGDTVRVHSRDEKWTEVATADGIIGYLPSSSISKGIMAINDYAYEEKEHPHLFMDKPISLVWHQVTHPSANRDIADTLSRIGNINVISPTWFYLNDNTGNIADLSSADYVAACHAQGVSVWGLISNLENPEVSTSAVLGSTSTRRHLIDNLINAALLCGMDGINVDFESLKADSIGDSFIQFIRELSLRCSEYGLVLSVDNYVMSSYTAFYNREEQAKFADYIIIMAYDEHYNGSDDGSVASLPWVEEGVVKTMEQVPSRQIILGNPFYTRVWRLTPKNGNLADVIDEENHSETYDISSEVLNVTNAFQTVEEHGVTPEWSAAEGQYYAQWEEGNSIYRVWLEDETSMKSRIELVNQYELAGAAFWKLGFENSSIWQAIDSTLH